MEQDSFTAKPPTITIREQEITLRPVNRGFLRLITAIEALTDNPESLGANIIIGFAAIYSLEPTEAFEVLRDPKRLETEIGAADMELSNEDVKKVDAYLSGVLDRAEAARVEIDPSPGKPSVPATRQPRQRTKSTSSPANMGGAPSKS